MNYQSRDARRSRLAYLFYCAFEYFVSLCLTDALLSNLLASQGFGDSAIGIISSLIALAAVFQLAALPIMHRVRNTKRFTIVVHTLSELLFMSLYLIPFLPGLSAIRKPLMITSILAAYLGKYLVSNLNFRWCNSFVDPAKRGIFGAYKEMISLISGMLVQLGIGYVMDRFQALDNLKGGLLFAAICILIFSISELVCMLLTAPEPPHEDTSSVRLSEILHATLGHSGYRATLIQLVLWYMAQYLTIGFLGIYKISDLCMSLTLVQVINMAASLARFFLSPFFGRFTDRRGFADGITLGLICAATANVFLFFTTSSTWWLIIGYQLLYSIGLAGLGQNFYNITYQYVEPQFLSEAMAIKFSIAGICGFLCSLLGSRILSFIQSDGNTLFGLPIHGQQVLGALSLLLILITILFTRTRLSIRANK